MANSVITGPAVVLNEVGRTGVCVYDNPAVTNNNHKSAYVIYADNTWKQSERINLTIITQGSFLPGTGPGN